MREADREQVADRDGDVDWDVNRGQVYEWWTGIWVVDSHVDCRWDMASRQTGIHWQTSQVGGQMGMGNTVGKNVCGGRK